MYSTNAVKKDQLL